MIISSIGHVGADAQEIAIEKNYTKWTQEEHEMTFNTLKAMTRQWQQSQSYRQYVVVGKYVRTEERFSWKIIPFTDATNPLKRFWKQVIVSWKVLFSKREQLAPKKMQDYTIESTQTPLQSREESAALLYQSATSSVSEIDPFCQQEIIEKQQIFSGDYNHVLCDIAPIGADHLLIVPKKHKTDFAQLSLEEYGEVTSLVKAVIQAHPEYYGCYLLHKTGKDAGQSVPHWHMHVVMIEDKRGDLLTKLRFLKGMLPFGRPRLSDSALRIKVEKLKTRLSSPLIQETPMGGKQIHF